MSARESISPRQRARLVFLVSLAVTALLYFIPQARLLAYPLMLLSTLAHEMGHGVTAFLTGASFERFQMWPDGSGVAIWSGEMARWRMALVAAGGLVGPALAAAGAFAAGRTARGARIGLYATAAILAIAEILVVRNVFALVFVGVILGVCILAARAKSAEVAQLVLVFFGIQLGFSVFSRGDYLFTPVAQTASGAMPSDVAQIAQAFFLPYWVWGGLCGGLSVLVLILGLKLYWR